MTLPAFSTSLAAKEAVEATFKAYVEDAARSETAYHSSSVLADGRNALILEIGDTKMIIEVANQDNLFQKGGELASQVFTERFELVRTGHSTQEARRKVIGFLVVYSEHANYEREIIDGIAYLDAYNDDMRAAAINNGWVGNDFKAGILTFAADDVKEQYGVEYETITLADAQDYKRRGGNANTTVVREIEARVGGVQADRSALGRRLVNPHPIPKGDGREEAGQ